MPAPVDLQVHRERLARDGFTVLADAVEPELTSGLREEVERVERQLNARPTPNPFEGPRTVRIYNLLAHGPLFARVPVHPAVLPLVEEVLGPECLVNSFNAITILPGERAQVLHTDDQLIPIRRPHPPIVCNTVWSLVDFTADNGATRVVPGSHRRDHAPGTLRDQATGRELARLAREAVPVPMRAGSVLVFDGSLWHCGGANRTRARRTAIAMNYCAGYLRQQENHFLGISREVAARLPARLRELLGYGMYAGLIGHVEKRDPATFLGAAAEGSVLFDPQSRVWQRRP